MKMRNEMSEQLQPGLRCLDTQEPRDTSSLLRAWAGLSSLVLSLTQTVPIRPEDGYS